MAATTPDIKQGNLYSNMADLLDAHQQKIQSLTVRKNKKSSCASAMEKHLAELTEVCDNAKHQTDIGTQHRRDTQQTEIFIQGFQNSTMLPNQTLDRKTSSSSGSSLEKRADSSEAVDVTEDILYQSWPKTNASDGKLEMDKLNDKVNANKTGTSEDASLKGDTDNNIANGHNENNIVTAQESQDSDRMNEKHANFTNATRNDPILTEFSEDNKDDAIGDPEDQGDAEFPIVSLHEKVQNLLESEQPDHSFIFAHCLKYLIDHGMCCESIQVLDQAFRLDECSPEERRELILSLAKLAGMLYIFTDIEGSG